MMMTSQAGCRALIASSRVRPSVSGNFRSTMATLKLVSARARRASGLLVAVVTSYPFFVSSRRKKPQTSASSSMIKTWICDMIPSLLQVNRQEQGEGATLARRAVYFDRAVVGLGNPEADRQPQARPLGGFLAGVKRGKDLGQVLRRDADAVVVNTQHRPPSPVFHPQLRRHRDDFLVPLHLGQGVPGIDEEIRQHLLDLGSVGSQAGEVRIQVLRD